MKFLFRSTVFVVILALGVSAGFGFESKKTIDHGIARENQFLYQISLQFLYQHICGGALIAPNLVLTAAHCVVKNGTYDDKPYVVVAGTTNLLNRNLSIPVKKIYYLRNYEQFSYRSGDIALLKLERNFKVSGTSPIVFVQLPVIYEKFTSGSAVVSGFGYDQVLCVNYQGHDTPSRVLKYEFLNIQECAGHRFDGVICGQTNQHSNSNPQGVCSFQGGSGDPLVVDGIVIGIVSTGSRCDESHSQVIFTEVSHHIDFINNVMYDMIMPNMVVKTVDYVNLNIPEMNLTGTTNSVELIRILSNLQIVFKKIKTVKEEMNEQKAIYVKEAQKLENARRAYEEQKHVLDSLTTEMELKEADLKADLDEALNKFDALLNEYVAQSSKK